MKFSELASSFSKSEAPGVWLRKDRAFDLDLEIFCPQERMKMGKELEREREYLMKKISLLDRLVYEITGRQSSASNSAPMNSTGIQDFSRNTKS